MAGMSGSSGDMDASARAFREHTEHSLFASLGAGARFNRRRFAADLKIFDSKANAPAAASGAAGARGPAAAPAANAASALDFFGTGAFSKLVAAPPAPTEQAPPQRKRKAAEPVESDSDGDEDEDRETSVDSAQDGDELAQPADGEAEDGDMDDDGDDPSGWPLDTPDNVQHFRRRMRIRVSGNDIPVPTPTFDALVERYSLPKFLARNLAESGYTRPTPIQMQGMPVIAEGRELLGCAPTGSGKTLSYVLPILHTLKAPSNEGYRAVIVVPTRELAQQIYREIKRLTVGRNFKACVLTKATAAVNTIGNKSQAKFDILITTPMRLVHMVQSASIDLSRVQHLVLDEGDKLLEMGFLEQVDEILAACTHPKLARHLLSATLPPSVEQLAKSFMRDPVQVEVGARNSAAQTVKQKLMYVGSEDGKLLALRQLIQSGVRPPVLVFVQSKERAKDLFHELVYDGINVDVIHSERTQAQRDKIVEQFRAGRIWFLIATDLMGRGMDFKGVNLVINYDFPQSIVSYIHRIGRAGRAGRPGEAVTFFTNDDTLLLRSVANVIKQSGGEVPDWMLQLKKATRNERKQLAKRPVARRDISAIPQFDKRQWGHKKQMIEQSKQKAKRQKQDE